MDGRKKGNPLQKKLRTKSDVIIITKTEGASYLTWHSSEGKKPQRSWRVELIELKNDADKLQLKPYNVTIVCKDLDKIKTPEEICEALQKECEIQNLEKTSVKSMTKARSGTQIVLVCMRAQDANVALKLSKVRIG